MLLMRPLFRKWPSGGAKSRRVIARSALALAGAALLAACQADETIYGYGPKDQRPVSQQTREQMDKLGMSPSSPVLMRIFKEESAFEVWKKDRTGRYALLKSYQICRWSGGLGPKIKEGDRQAPEGFYPISPALMNPNSDWYLAFNTGFPNAYDRVNGRTGSALMVHGSCSSRGCYAMTDAQIQDIYALARDAFKGGQKYFQLEAFPFRLTAENMAKHWNDPNMPFWKMLKEGYDTFELTHQEPKVDVCGRKYVFNANPTDPLDPATPCPAALNQPPELLASLSAKAKADDDKAALLFASLEQQRKDEEDKKVQLALAAEKKQREDEQRRIEAERNPGMLASLFSTATANQTPAADEIAVGPVIVPPTGAPVPTADPRGPQLHMMALAEPEPQPPREASLTSTFTRLFSFSSSEPKAIPEVAAAPAPTTILNPAASGPSTVVAPTTSSPSTGTVAPGAIASGAISPAAPPPRTPASKPAPSVVQTASPVPHQPQPASQVPAPAGSPAGQLAPAPTCAPAGTPASSDVPACPTPAAASPTVSAAETAQSKSIIDRIGNWF